MTFSQDIKKYIVESKKLFDQSVNKLVYDKSLPKIEKAIQEFDLYAHEIGRNKYLLRLKVANIGNELWQKITGNEVLIMKQFGKFRGWQVDGEPRSSDMLNVVLDKNYTITKIYAGRERKDEQLFFDSFKYVTGVIAEVKKLYNKRYCE